jgi:hypothetical protein
MEKLIHKQENLKSSIGIYFFGFGQICQKFASQIFLHFFQAQFD